MNIRERLNENRGMALVVVLVLGGAVFVFKRSLQSGETSGNSTGFPSRAFYSTDDGATLFKDNYLKVPPFLHEGKPAARAFVFTCDDGKHQFVQYLKKYSDEAKAVLEQQVSQSGLPPVGTGLVKRPGAGAWVTESNPQGIEIITPKCPDGMSGDQIRQVSAD